MFLFGLAVLSICAAIFLGFCIRFSPWGFSDSAAYFSAARNLSNGLGLGLVNPDGSFSLLRVFAPLYPIVLSLFAGSSIDLINIAAWINIVTFSLFIFLSGWLFFRVSSSQSAGFLFALLLAASPTLVFAFSGMMSEPLAFLFGIPGLLLVFLAIKEQSRKYLILASVFSGLAFFSRYAFVAVPAAGVFSLLLFSKSKMGKRVIDALIYGAISAGSMLLWMGYEGIHNATIGSKHFVLHFNSNTIFKAVGEIINITKFWLPYHSNMIPGVSSNWFSPLLGLLFLLLVAAGLILLISRRTQEDQKNSGLIVCGFAIFLVAYLTLFIVSFAFTDESVPTNERLLSPLIPGIMGILLGSTVIVDKYLNIKKRFPITAVIICLFFLVHNSVPLYTRLTVLSRYPEGYTSPIWRGKPIFTAISSLPEKTPLLSNAPDIILFYTNRSAYFLTDFEKSSGIYISSKDSLSIQKLLEQKCGMLVLFDVDTARRQENKNFLIKYEEIDRLQKANSVIYQDGDAVILQSPKCPPMQITVK